MEATVVYWSETGNTEAMAGFVAEGIGSAGWNANIIPADGFDASMLGKYSSIAFGCPSMGDEILEEDVFEPMFSSVEMSLSGKRVGLFGSYGWGDGQWMRDWEDKCRSSGIDIIGPGVMANEFPDGEAAEECRAPGRNLCS